MKTRLTRPLVAAFLVMAALALGSGLIYMALRLLYDQGHGRARRMFMYSNIYLALLFLAMVADRLAVRP